MLENIELSRQKIQKSLDSGKTMLERNLWGQYATPPRLADEILEYAKSLLPVDSAIRFLDPAFGTGSFYSSLLKEFPKERIEKRMGFEKDETVALESRRIWQDTRLDLHIDDFTLAEIPRTEQDKANLIICNPPYIRHHHLSSADKTRLKFLSDSITGRSFSGLTGFYGYFMAICHAWMAKGATAGWLIPSEFMDVNYGREIKKYLLDQVILLRIHRYDPEDAQFDDALVSSSVVWFTNTAPESDHQIEFTFGGSLKEPHERKHISAEKAAAAPKWSILPFTRPETKNTAETCKLSDLFSVKRGLATGANEFFILSPRQIDEHNLPKQFLIPILPSSRYIRDNVVEADPKGNPILEQQLYLLNCSLPEDKIKSDFPFLWKYLQTGVEMGINERCLCKSRTPWYSQENRPAAPIVCTYMGRSNKETGKPFRFILNHSMATAANGFLMMYPKPNLFNSKLSDSDFIISVWQQLNNLSANEVTDEGRVYGGGLYKIEPRELGNIKIRI